jgi:proteasome lid subunit RPN8/RPN11
LVLPQAVRLAILLHARREAPRECCGFLVGRDSRIALAVPMRNADARPRARYRIDPLDHIRVRRLVRELAPGLQIVGVYHSHPHDRPVPSRSDVDEAYYPEWAHVIIGRPRETIRAYRIQRGRVASVEIV